MCGGLQAEGTSFKYVKSCYSAVVNENNEFTWNQEASLNTPRNC